MFLILSLHDFNCTLKNNLGIHFITGTWTICQSWQLIWGLCWVSRATLGIIKPNKNSNNNEQPQKRTISLMKVYKWHVFVLLIFKYILLMFIEFSIIRTTTIKWKINADVLYGLWIHFQKFRITINKKSTNKIIITFYRSHAIPCHLTWLPSQKRNRNQLHLMVSPSSLCPACSLTHTLPRQSEMHRISYHV